MSKFLLEIFSGRRKIPFKVYIIPKHFYRSMYGWFYRLYAREFGMVTAIYLILMSLIVVSALT